VTDPEKRPSIFTRQVTTLLLAGIAYFIVAGISFPVLPRLVEQRIGGDDFDIGLTFGAMAAGMLVMRPFVGYLSDRHGRKPLMVIGAVAVGGAQLLHVPAADVGLWCLLLVRFGLGMASSAMYLGQATTATELPPQERSAEIFSTFGVAVFVGFAIGPVVGETMLEAYGFSAAFAVGAVAAGACAALGLLLPETKPRDVVARFDGVSSLFHPIAARAGAVSFLVFSAFIGFTAFVTPYAESLGLGQVRWVLLTYSVTSLITRAIGGRLIATMDRLLLGTMGHLAAASGLAIIVVFNDVWALYLGALVLAAGLSFNVPLMVLVAAESAPASERSRVVATVVVFGDLANSAAAFGLGALANGVGYRGMYTVVIVITLGAAVLYRSPFTRPVTAIREPAHLGATMRRG
jgi:MFS family permease